MLAFALRAPSGVGAPYAQSPGIAAHRPAAHLGEVTIQALRDRHALRSVVAHFVLSTLIGFDRDAYPRWDQPVCPLVAGLAGAQGEFILGRIVQVARAAHVPLAGLRCRANLFVMFSRRPHLLLKLWWAKDRNMYDTREGIAPVRRFIASHRPIHVWYNTAASCAGTPLGSASPDGALVSAGVLVEGGGMLCGHGVDTLLHKVTVRGFSSVILVVDKKRVHGMTFGQLAAYVALRSLAQVNPQAHGGVPTILRLLQGSRHPPQDLTAWDRALLYGLYHTAQASTLQVSEVNASVLKKIERWGRAPRAQSAEAGHGATPIG